MTTTVDLAALAPATVYHVITTADRLRPQADSFDPVWQEISRVASVITRAQVVEHLDAATPGEDFQDVASRLAVRRHQAIVDRTMAGLGGVLRVSVHVLPDRRRAAPGGCGGR